MTVIYSGQPEVGTFDDDYVIGSAYYASRDGTITAGDGDDLVLGDIANIVVPDENATNTSFRSSLALEGIAGLWTTDENPLVGDSAVPHTSTFCEAAPADSEQYYSITAGAGQTITVDVDFGAATPIGGGADCEVELWRETKRGIWSRVDSADGSHVSDGGFGSFGADGSSDDPFLSFTTQYAGTYAIVIGRHDPATGASVGFTGGESFVANVSVTGHATSSNALGGNDTIDGGDGDDALFGCAGNDTISGGTGDDLVHGGSGVETLHGNDGNDII